MTREELSSGNRESFRQAFFSRDSILLWVLRTYRRNRSKYGRLQSSEEWKHIRFSVHRSPAQASEYLLRSRTASDAVREDADPPSDSPSSRP